MDSSAKSISTGTTAETTGEPAVSSSWLSACPAPLRALILRARGIPVVRFLYVSTISTVVDYAVLFLLNACLPGWTYLAVIAHSLHGTFRISASPHTISTFLAVAAGYLIGTVVNFVMARRIVFRPSGYHTHIEFVLVATVAAVAFGLTEWIFLTLHEHHHWSVFMAKTAAVLLVFFWNFFARRLLIYRTAGDMNREEKSEGSR